MVYAKLQKDPDKKKSSFSLEKKFFHFKNSENSYLNVFYIILSRRKKNQGRGGVGFCCCCCWFCLETSLTLCAVQAGLELSMYSRLVLNSQQPPKC